MGEILTALKAAYCVDPNAPLPRTFQGQLDELEQIELAKERPNH